MRVQVGAIWVVVLGMLTMGLRALAADPAPEPKAGEITGVVLNDKGEPIEGAVVDAWTWQPGNETKTGKDGRFHLKKLDPREKIELRISKDGFSPWYNPQQETGAGDLSVTLTDKTYLEGAVTAPDGKPVSNALIRADNGPHKGDGVQISTLWTETRSGADGKYRLYVTPGKYDVQVRVPRVGAWRSGSRVDVADGQTQTIDIALEKGIIFTAKAVDSQTGEPVPGVKLSNWEHKDVSGVSDEDGQISIDGMQPGKFEFNVKAAGYARWWSDQATEQHERVPDGKRNFDDLTFNLSPELGTVTVTLEKAVTITGKVVDPDGKPVAGATVAPAHTGSGNSLTGDTRFSVPTKKDGTFQAVLPASLEQRHNLVAHDGKYGQTRKWANGVGEVFQSKPGQRMENVTLKLTRGATVKGRALTNSGEPAVDKRVRAMMTDGLDNRYYVPETRTDKDGRFELKHIRPGDAMVQVEPFWLDPNQAPGGSTQTSTLADGETKDDVELTQAPERR
jgi:protocatechuate 3,4-dioxygenase beta subunit